jgi:DNA-binding response OmpR family regulator
MKPSVLLVEDDRELCIELATYLTSSGFSVRSAGTLAAASAALADAPQLLVLDINLPDGSGLELFRQLDQQLNRIGVVMCTGRDERELRIACLRDGADAYLVKPVDPEELEATLLCVHRRVSSANPELSRSLLIQQRVIERPWHLDVVERVLSSPNGVAVLLSASEVAILKALFCNAQRFASREDLIEQTDGIADSGSAHRLEALISRLRRKIGDKAGLKLPLRSAYGRGYEFSGRVQWGE